MKATITIILLVLLAINCFPQEKKPTNKHERSGYNYDQAGNYTEAIKSFNKAIKRTPKSRTLLLKRADCYFKVSDFESAISDCDKVIALSHQYDSLFLAGKLLKANCLERVDKPMQAKEIYHEILSVRPGHAVTLFLLGSLYGENDQYDSCQYYLLKAHQIDPTSIGPMINLIFFSNEMGYYENALDYGENYAHMFQDPVWQAINKNNMGYSNIMLGKDEEGLALIEESIRLYPSNSFAYKNRALYYLKKKDLASACIDLDKSKELGGYHITKDLIEKYCNR